MYTTVDSFFTDASSLVSAFNTFAEKHNLTNSALADHVCYKCGSHESFESLRALFEHSSGYIYQSIISHRRIAYIRFTTPLATVLGPIWYLELSDQKPDSSQTDGFDHIEVYPTDGTYTQMVERLSETEAVIHVERPHHTTDDIALPGGFLFRCTSEPLVEKIKREEMV